MMTTTRRMTGPRRLAYIPPQFREIEGVEQLTTVRQLEKLKSYLETPEPERPACVRVGASVPQHSDTQHQRSTSTYAVTVDGRVSVIKLERDPRSAHKWFMNPLRPWNLCMRFAPAGGE